jgi:hypothetical protein
MSKMYRAIMISESIIEVLNGEKKFCVHTCGAESVWLTRWLTCCVTGASLARSAWTSLEGGQVAVDVEDPKPK